MRLAGPDSGLGLLALFDLVRQPPRLVGRFLEFLLLPAQAERVACLDQRALDESLRLEVVEGRCSASDRSFAITRRICSSLAHSSAKERKKENRTTARSMGAATVRRLATLLLFPLFVRGARRSRRIALDQGLAGLRTSVAELPGNIAICGSLGAGKVANCALVRRTGTYARSVVVSKG